MFILKGKIMDNDSLMALEPNASSLIESMRSIGYSFESAIADIIDNSISAKASEIQIFLLEEDGNPYIQIVDDGFGMGRDELLEAMRLGSKNPNEIRSKDDLGRFGLGLKSASFSQCRVLSVISKKNSKIHSFQWDLDLVMKTNKFVVKELLESEIEKINNVELLNEIDSGTIVQWEKFDRINDSTNDLQSEMTDLMNIAIEHISLIFHRFLNDNLNIYVNNEKIIPKDPFLSKNSGTQERPIEKIRIENEIITLHPFVLPHISKLNNEDKRLAGKVNEYYKEQGFYLYRNKRLIVWGSYLGVSRKSELGKNLRIQVDIPNSLDYLWNIDVKKSRATVPSIIKKNLIKSIVDGEQTSKRIYKFRGNSSSIDSESIWRYFEDRDNNFHFEINDLNPIYKQLLNLMSEDGRKLFHIYLNALSENIPFQKIYAELADGKAHSTIDDENEIQYLKDIMNQVKNSSYTDYKEFLKSLLSIEPYKSSQESIKLINEEMERN